MISRASLGVLLLAGLVAVSACSSEADSSPQDRSEPGTVVGMAAAQGAFPWMASTQLAGSAPCGGALIAPTWVLTGKHCHGNSLTNNPERWQVRIGSVDRTQGGELIDAKRFVDYPDDEIDLALIELASPSSAPPLALIPVDNEQPYEVGAAAITLGWGTDGNTKRAAKLLDWNPQVTAENSTCGGGENGIFCAGRPGDQGAGTCMFDSGAPYVWADQGFGADGAPKSTPYFAGTLRGLNNETCGVPGKNDDWQSTGGEYGDWIRQQIGS